MKKIHFIRHGRTGGNELGMWQTFDQDLSDHGRGQAKKVAERLKGMNIDTLIASDMDRAVETATIINEALGLNLLTTKLLHEIHRPSVVRGKLKTDTAARKIVEEIAEHWGDLNWKHSDEENFFDLQSRVEKAIEELIKLPGETIAAVTHEYVLRMIFAVITFGRELTPAAHKSFVKLMWHENTGITTFTYDNGVWRLHSWNDHAHLLE